MKNNRMRGMALRALVLGVLLGRTAAAFQCNGSYNGGSWLQNPRCSTCRREANGLDALLGRQSH